ncbi:hypothetical protein [Roseomonas xinghualingensis]|uniref:hypothetical protein n=1 Tax=Roseomonas xinghualingensis TaxID=2986475 RepID=UPI0021F1F2F6|nr:hypothetical protein [Roseomonas sp. SXEYE001]MCV4207164.1 hypothetical protein [Roseomonas sp. SXEYE001]
MPERPPPGFARIHGLRASRVSALAGATHYVVEYETLSGEGEAEIPKERLIAHGVFDAFWKGQFVPLPQ